MKNENAEQAMRRLVSAMQPWPKLELFGYLTEALGGEVIRISATSDTHVNALDMDRAYGDERNPIVSKSEFVLSLFEQLIGDGMVTAKEMFKPSSVLKTVSAAATAKPPSLKSWALATRPLCSAFSRRLR